MIYLKNLKKTYNKNKPNAFEALHDITLQIKKGELVAIIGASGAGKSTLLHILAFIDNYDEGNYYLDGELMKDLSDKETAQIRNKKIGIVMQDFALVEDFTALENVLLPLDFDKQSKLSKKEKKDCAINVLQQVNMEAYANKKCNQLSGGQKQRIAIARAVVNNPDIVIADEPTGALDSNSATQIMDLLKSLNQEGKTIIIVTHDMHVAEYANRIIKISDGNIIE